MDCIYVYFLILQYKYSATRIYIYTDIRIYEHTAIHTTPAVFFTFTFIYLSISVSDFDLTFRPLVVIFDFYSAKVSQAGNTANTYLKDTSSAASAEAGILREIPEWLQLYHSEIL